MLFQRLSAHPFKVSGPFFRLRRTFFSLIVFAAGTALLHAQTQPAPAGTQAPPDTSSSSSTLSTSSDVQTMKVLHQKEVYPLDFAISGFGQDTNRTIGNNIRNGTTSSGGGMVSFRQSHRWWLGYEVNYGYTKFTDTYYNAIYLVKHNSNEFSAGYLVKSPEYKGFRFFGTLGAGIMSMSPTQYGGVVPVVIGAPATQTVPMFVYSAGAEKHVTEHFGIRAQYRSDEYKDPDFKQPNLDTFKLRKSAEPAIGVYYRF